MCNKIVRQPRLMGLNELEKRLEWSNYFIKPLRPWSFQSIMAHCSVPERPSKCKIIEKLGEQGEKGSYSKVNWNVNCHSKCYRHLFLWCLHKEAEKIECTINPTYFYLKVYLFCTKVVDTLNPFLPMSANWHLYRFYSV